VAGN